MSKEIIRCQTRLFLEGSDGVKKQRQQTNIKKKNEKLICIVYRSDDLRINRLGQDSTTGRDVVNQLSERCSLYFFAFKVGYRVQKIKAQTTLAKFPNEELLLFAGRDICEPRNDKKNYFPGKIVNEVVAQ